MKQEMGFHLFICCKVYVFEIIGIASTPSPDERLTAAEAKIPPPALSLDETNIFFNVDKLILKSREIHSEN